MKNSIGTLAFATFVSLTAFAQDKPVKFSVSVSTDSVLMDNYFEVKFTLENANGENFEAPAFDHFNVVSGPNFSTSMSMVNGDVTQSMTITYYLEPKDIGSYYILPASVKAKDKTLQTAPLGVLVVPNPDGIKQVPERRQDLFDWGSPFDFEKEFPFPHIRPDNKPQPQPEPGQKPKKKKRTIRI